jgi:predicted small metal-binding protein
MRRAGFFVYDDDKRRSDVSSGDKAYDTVFDELDSCKSRLERREAELMEASHRLGREILARRSQNDMTGVKAKLTERRNLMTRVSTLQKNILLVTDQIEALKNSELDRELMQTLMVSSNALKNAGIGKGAQEAEEVMTELGEHMKEASELTSVLAQHIDSSVTNSMEEEDALDIEAELAKLSEEFETFNNIKPVSVPPVPVKLPNPEEKERRDEIEPLIINNAIPMF